MFGTLAGMLLIGLMIAAALADLDARGYVNMAVLAVAAITCAILELAMAVNRRR